MQFSKHQGEENTEFGNKEACSACMIVKNKTYIMQIIVLKMTKIALKLIFDAVFTENNQNYFILETSCGYCP